MYKFGTIYRPMLFTLRNYDFCSLIANKDRLENLLAKKLLAGFEMGSTKFLEGCPYHGNFYFPSFDPNMIADLLPPVVPSGN